MPRGKWTSEAIAESLGIHRRTLHQHLVDAGLDFTTLPDAMGLELAQHSLTAPALRMTEIPNLLGFNAASSLTRWFTQNLGVSPTQWRRATAAVPQP